MIIKNLLLTILLLTSLSTIGQTVNATMNVAINSIVTSTTTGSPNIAPFVTESDIENGLITDPISFAVKSNRLWKLTTSITNITASPITGGPTAITAPLQPSNILWGVVNGSNGTVTLFTPFVNTTSTSAGPVEAKTGVRGNPSTTGNTFTLRYKVIPTFTVDPANYVVEVTYTLSNQ